MHRHIYEYPHQGEIIPAECRGHVISEAVENAEMIWVVQTDLPVCMGGTYGAMHVTQARQMWIEKMQGKRIVLLHGGGHYRDNREFYRQIWEPVNPISICYEADLMGTFQNEHLVVPPLSASWVPRYERNWGKPLRVGHYPSRPTDKGSEWMVPLLSSMACCQFNTSVVNPYKEDGVIRAKWPHQLERMAQCDVIVDQIKPELKGKAFGEWVSIATETAMLGRIPIANSLNTQPYVATYGREPGLHVCNTQEDLIAEIERLASLGPTRLKEEQAECRNWADTCHELKPTGKVLKRICQIS